MTPFLRSISALCLGVAALAPSASRAGLYWEQGVRSKSVSVCFVGNAPSLRAARVAQIEQYLREYEYAANVKFKFLGDCPAATHQANGNDFYDGDIRVVIPNVNVSGTGLVPGKGCQDFIENGSYNHKNDGWGSWSNAPNDLTPNRACVYNLKLGDDPWNDTPYLNHTLHEFGHALGLSHEHARNDVDKAHCTAKDYGGNVSDGHITIYDKLSVMHYAFPTCGIEGNYGYSGLSAMDRLSVHIMYPEEKQVAEFVGTTVIPSTNVLSLVSAWRSRGADMNFAASNFSWSVSGTQVGTGASVDTKLSPGDYTLAISHKDFLGRSYSYSGPVHVLAPKDYARFAASVTSAQSALLH
jgi:hypothetical protein